MLIEALECYTNILFSFCYADVALEVFNKCTEVSRKDDDDCITLYYEFLDDTYSKWSTEEKMDHISGSDFVFDASLLDGLFTDKTSSNRQLDKKENHPLDIMVGP